MRAVREQGPRLRRGRDASGRPLAAGRPGAHRRDLQSGPPRQLHGRGDPRRPAHRLRPAHGHGRDQRHHHARKTRSPTPPRWPRSTSGTSSTSARCRPCATRGPPTAGGRRQPSTDVLGRPIDDFGLSVRSLNSLKNSNIRTLEDLVEFSEDDLLKVKNVGEKALSEIAELLQREGLNFGMGFEEVDGELRVARPGVPPMAQPSTGAGEASNAASRQGPPALPDRRATAGRMLNNMATSLFEHGRSSPPRPRPRSSGRSPRGSSPWRAGATCTRAGWSSGGSRTARSSAGSSPRSARGSPRGPVATPGSSSWGIASATAPTWPGSSCSPSDRALRDASAKRKGDPSGPLFLDASRYGATALAARRSSSGLHDPVTLQALGADPDPLGRALDQDRARSAGSDTSAASSGCWRG